MTKLFLSRKKPEKMTCKQIQTEMSKIEVYWESGDLLYSKRQEQKLSERWKELDAELKKRNVSST